MPTPEPSTPPQQVAEQRDNSMHLSHGNQIRILTLQDDGFTYQ
jgi:hypothetical protein